MATLQQPSTSGRYRHLSSTSVNRGKALASAPLTYRAPFAPFKVEAAISRAKKEAIVASLTEKLNSSTLAYGLRFKDIPVKKVEAMRRSLPSGATMVVAKNNLLRVAVDNLPENKEKWQGLRDQTGDNAWVFSDEDSIRGSVEAYQKFFKELKDEQFVPKGVSQVPPPTEVTTIVLDGNVLAATEMKTLEKLPTKMELLTKIAVGIKANPTKIALSIKNIPRKIAYGVRALSELNEDTSMTVEQAVAAKASASE